MISIVIIFGIFIAIQLLKSSSTSIFSIAIITFLLLPSIMYILITAKSYTLEKIIIPGLFLISSEYYFFHDYEVWISSDANAAIGLLMIPIYLIFVLVFSYLISYFISKVKNQ
jgi:hypothetical protein